MSDTVIYYNALVYTDYGAVIPYHDITKLDSFLQYMREYVSYTKIFLYRKPHKKAERGIYCAFHYPNMQGFQFK